MNLGTVLNELLLTEDEAVASVDEARRKAAEILREARERFAADQEERLTAARAQAKELVESARRSGELEAAQIAEMGAQERRQMTEHFAHVVPEAVRSLVEETVARLTHES